MKQIRISRKQVNTTCEALGYELIVHQELANRKNYYYLYSVIDTETREIIIDRKPLNKVYDIVAEKLREKCEKMYKENHVNE